VEGQTVKAGDVLVRIAVPELEAQRAQAKARVDAAEAAHEKAKNGPRKEEIQAADAAVQAAQARLQRLKTGWREEEIRQAKSDMDAADADLTWAREDFDRISRLFLQGGNAVSRTDYDAARAARDRALGRQAAAKAKYEMVVAGSRAEDIAEAQAEVKRMEAQLQLLRAGTRPEEVAAAAAQLAEARARLQEIDANLAEAVVRAPGTAIIETLSVRPGDLVAPNQPVVRILRADDVWVKVYVPETELGKVTKNQSVEVTIDSHPGRRFAGRVIHIASISEFLPRNVQSVEERKHQVFGTKVLLTEPDAVAIFKPGMAAHVTLPLGP
jgi:multidrug resistance efflux pump